MLIARFWWGNSMDKRRIHWLNWDKLCVAKLDGRLGFKDFEAFNLALLAKQGWRMIHNDSSLCARVFKGKYFPTSSFLNAKLGYNPFFV